MRTACLTMLLARHPTQRTVFATQSRFSKLLRLLLSIFLIIMAMLRSQRASIGALLHLLHLNIAAVDPFQVPAASCIFSMKSVMLLVSVFSAR
jgi:hypothetical protein